MIQPMHKIHVTEHSDMQLQHISVSCTVPLVCNRIKFTEVKKTREVPVENLLLLGTASYPWGFNIYGATEK